MNRISKMLRVDHAGELGATWIYKGQLFVLGNDPKVRPVLEHMLKQEQEHLKGMDSFIAEYRVRPSLLYPLWQAAGFALGAGTALMGKESAMACTEAVETVIGQHYNEQLRELIATEGTHTNLCKTIAKFRDEELEHLETAIDNESQKAPAYSLLKTVIENGCRIAIKAAKYV